MNLALVLALGASSFAVATADLVQSTYKGSSGLHDMAKSSGKYMGTAVDQDLKDAAALKVLKDLGEFGMITPCNAMKWDATENEKNKFTYDAAEAIIAVAKESGAKVRCHTLVWYKQTPDWVHGLNKEDMLSALENHITKVMTHFGDTCYAWDVANEVMEENGQMRDSFWYKTTGMDFMKTAFKTANSVKKSLGLKTKLYYNDFNTNTINDKSTGVLKMVKGLMDEGITVDGVGFQSHFGFADPATTADQVANLERFTALGLDVALTELDVTASSPFPSAEEQAKQANVYKNTVAACKEVEKCVGVTIWGFDDNYSWLSTNAPLPWYQPGGASSPLVRKSLYDGIVAGWGGSSSNSSQTANPGTSSGTEEPSIAQPTATQPTATQPTATEGSAEAPVTEGGSTEQTANTSSGSNTQSWNTGTEIPNPPNGTTPTSDSNTQNTGTGTDTDVASDSSHAKCNRRLRD